MLLQAHFGQVLHGGCLNGGLRVVGLQPLVGGGGFVVFAGVKLLGGHLEGGFGGAHAVRVFLLQGFEAAFVLCNAGGQRGGGFGTFAELVLVNHIAEIADSGGHQRGKYPFAAAAPQVFGGFDVLLFVVMGGH